MRTRTPAPAFLGASEGVPEPLLRQQHPRQGSRGSNPRGKQTPRRARTMRTQEGLTCLTRRLSGTLGSGCDKTDGEENVSHGHRRKRVASGLRTNGRDFATSFPAAQRWVCVCKLGAQSLETAANRARTDTVQNGVENKSKLPMFFCPLPGQSVK